MFCQNERSPNWFSLGIGTPCSISAIKVAEWGPESKPFFAKFCRAKLLRKQACIRLCSASNVIRFTLDLMRKQAHELSIARPNMNLREKAFGVLLLACVFSPDTYSQINYQRLVRLNATFPDSASTSTAGIDGRFTFMDPDASDYRMRFSRIKIQ